MYLMQDKAFPEQNTICLPYELPSLFKKSERLIQYSCGFNCPNRNLDAISATLPSAVPPMIISYFWSKLCSVKPSSSEIFVGSLFDRINFAHSMSSYSNCLYIKGDYIDTQKKWLQEKNLFFSFCEFHTLKLDMPYFLPFHNLAWYKILCRNLNIFCFGLNLYHSYQYQSHNLILFHDILSINQLHLFLYYANTSFDNLQHFFSNIRQFSRLDFLPQMHYHIFNCYVFHIHIH